MFSHAGMVNFVIIYYYQKTLLEENIPFLLFKLKAWKEKLFEKEDQFLSSFFLRPFQANVPFVECQNGCCESRPCLNGGTCHETCDVIGTRFACECGLHAIGKYCETGKKS